MKELFNKQVEQLQQGHFLLLYWIAKAESETLKYNITFAFDDLKYLGITRTKQNVVSYIDSLEALCFIRVQEEHNRKNLYITEYGAKSLEILVQKQLYSIKPSNILERSK